MILCFQCADLAKIFLVSKFHTDWPNIELVIAFCAIWHYRELKDVTNYFFEPITEFSKRKSKQTHDYFRQSIENRNLYDNK